MPPTPHDKVDAVARQHRSRYAPGECRPRLHKRKGTGARRLRHLSGPFCIHRPFSHHLAAVIGWQLLPERVTREPKAISLAEPTPKSPA